MLQLQLPLEEAIVAAVDVLIVGVDDPADGDARPDLNAGIGSGAQVAFHDLDAVLHPRLGGLSRPREQGQHRQRRQQNQPHRQGGGFPARQIEDQQSHAQQRRPGGQLRRGEQARQAAPLAHHGQPQHRDDHRSQQRHGPGEFLPQQPHGGAEGQHQGHGAQSEQEHGQPAPHWASAGQGQQLHALQRPAGHQPVQQPDGKGAERPPGEEAGQLPAAPWQQTQHVQPHGHHGRPGQQLHRPLQAVGQGDGGGLQAHAHRAQRRAHGGIGQEPAQIIARGGLPGGLRLPDAGEALGQPDAAAHGHAVHRGQQPHHEEHPIAHGAVRQLGGGQVVENSPPV